MKRTLAYICFLLALRLCVGSTALANDCKGVVHGFLVDSNGQPARDFHLTLDPLITNGDYIAPHAQTDETGQFRFEFLCAHNWAVVPSFEQPDYPIEYASLYRLLYGPNSLPGADTSDDHSAVETRIQLPSKPAILQVQVVDQRTGSAIKNAEVQVKLAKRTKLRYLGWVDTYFDGRVTRWPIPPDRDVVVRVRASGYREWKPNGKRGTLIHPSPGAQFPLEVSLQPLGD